MALMTLLEPTKMNRRAAPFREYADQYFFIPIELIRAIVIHNIKNVAVLLGMSDGQATIELIQF